MCRGDRGPCNRLLLTPHSTLTPPHPTPHVQAAEDAAALERAAAARRSESARFARLVEEREAAARAAERKGEAAMDEYNHVLAEAQRLRDEAQALAADAEHKRKEAVEALERVAAEVFEAERAAAIESQQETVRQAAHAAAAAARAKHEIAAAAKAKAEEEAAIAQAHLIAKQEAEAQAQMQLAEQRLRLARQKKEAVESQIEAFRAEAHADTQAAAQDAAEVDARTRAAQLVHLREREAEYLAHRAEMDWDKAEAVRERMEESAAGVPAGSTATLASSSSTTTTASVAKSSVSAAKQRDIDSASNRSIAGSDVADVSTLGSSGSLKAAGGHRVSASAASGASGVERMDMQEFLGSDASSGSGSTVSGSSASRRRCCEVPVVVACSVTPSSLTCGCGASPAARLPLRVARGSSSACDIRLAASCCHRYLSPLLCEISAPSHAVCPTPHAGTVPCLPPLPPLSLQGSRRV